MAFLDRNRADRRVLCSLVICSAVAWAAIVAPIRGAWAEPAVAIRIEDPDRAPVVDAVVSLVPIGGAGSSGTGSTRSGPPRATMDQVDLAFVPHVLAVAVGTVVDFPNSDQVRHSIYSFSAARTFEVKLYRGFEAPPITFDQPGLVVLGCNIHDHMVGYVYVLEARHFGVSDAEGKVVLGGIRPGRYRLELRHPRLEESIVLARDVELPAGAELVVPLDVRPPSRPAPRRDVDPLQSLFGEATR